MGNGKRAAEPFPARHELLSQGKNRAAAGQLRVAAAYLDMQASRGQGQQDQQLDQSAQDLRHQAKQIINQNGQVQQKEQQHLTQCFAKADQALASHLQSLAKNEFQNNKQVMAGHDLLTAADSLSSAYVWSGQQPAQQATNAISNAHFTAERLLAADQNYTPSEDNAQPAGAKMNANNENQNQNEAQNQNGSQASPQQAIDQLGQAIQSANFDQSQNQQSQKDQSNSSK